MSPAWKRRYTRRVRRSTRIVGALRVCLVVWPLLRATTTLAHTFGFTEAVAVLKSDGTYQVDMRIDVDALVLGVSATVDSALIVGELRAFPPAELEECIQRAAETLRRRVRIEFDGKRQENPVIRFPQFGTVLIEGAAQPTMLGTIARFEGRIPDHCAVFSFGASRAFQAVHLTIVDLCGGGTVKHVLDPGATSPPHTIGQRTQDADTAAVAGRYLVLGFEHILPKGVDHILFVLGLFLLSTKWRPLLWQITAFTIAHSATLALSMGGVIELPSRLVETLIALSIAYVAVENLFTTELKPWRPALVFLFGLLHGLGFAGVLRELGLPSGEFVTTLVTFNIGVELGQLAVVLLAFALVGWFREARWYRRAVVMPVSVLIALTGLYWSVERGLLGV